MSIWGQQELQYYQATSLQLQPSNWVREMQRQQARSMKHQGNNPNHNMRGGMMKVEPRAWNLKGVS